MLVDIENVTPALVAPLRRQHAADLLGMADPLVTALSEAEGALHVGLIGKGGPVGYATFSPEHRDERALLEIYVQPDARHLAQSFLNAALSWVMPVYWEIHSYDRVGLSLAMNAGHTLKLPHTWLYTQAARLPGQLPQGVTVRPALAADAEALAALIPATQAPDEAAPFSFTLPKAPPFPVDRAVPPAASLAEEGHWLLAYNAQGELVACAAAAPSQRTPSYATAWVGVVPAWRRRGLGSALLGALAERAPEAGQILAAGCGTKEIAAHKLLSRAGFYADGRIWRLKL